MEGLMEGMILIGYALVTALVALYGHELRMNNADPSGYHDEPIPGSQFSMRRVKNSPREARFGARLVLFCWAWPVILAGALVWFLVSGTWNVIKDATKRVGN